MIPLPSQVRQRLGNQIARGDTILFTGAGFSLAARTNRGNSVPGVGRLKELLWEVAFPGQPLDTASTLGDIYECAARRAGNATDDLLRANLTIDQETIDDAYRTWFSFPWFRIYTLNVDDLDEAVQLAYNLPRKIRSVSALTEGLPPEGSDLLSIHLNGRVADYPAVTFSPRQYGERTARPDAWYQHLVADLASHPIVFVGTELDEPPLWQQMELRSAKGARHRELRPGSYLVTPRISVARRTMLESLNIHWIEADQESFAVETLATMESERQQGLAAIASRVTSGSGRRAVYRIAELRADPDDGSAEFFHGREPTWTDLTSGRAVKREFEEHLANSIANDNPQVVLVTGTAGSGKTVTLMRIALEHDAAGETVVVVKSNTEQTPQAIRSSVEAHKPSVIVIDDADNFGRRTIGLIKGLAADNPNAMVVCTMRSTKLDQLEVDHKLTGVRLSTFAVPHLEDSDISRLLDALESAGRLGKLRNLPRNNQYAAFRKRAGRQLLVAMIEATSDERFEIKIDRECSELSPQAGLIYAVVALATSLRSFVTKDELLLATGDSTNAALNVLERLVAQRLLVITNGNEFRVRHRVIADRVIEYYRLQAQLGQPLEGLLWVMAAKTHPESNVHSREIKLLSRLMNHGFMLSLTADSDMPRRAYASIDELQRWNYHYYLQRGSYEVEAAAGDLDLAKNFLEQARNLAPDDYMVQTEWAYMSLKRAAVHSSATWAVATANEAIVELEEAILKRGSEDSYPYHVLGSQGLSWIRRAPFGNAQKGQELGRLLRVVRDGLKYHPSEQSLRQLADDLEREYLLTATLTAAPP
ncbi:MAG TPA: DNA/RNA helicase domain-containing protein [Thermoanaerobaculia bacterium]|nr:DNA/RNA helicase domain-containing protein [Thermoanaerobaculia bacterium]